MWGIKLNAIIHGINELKETGIVEIDFTAVAPASPPGLLRTTVKKFEVGITA